MGQYNTHAAQQLSSSFAKAVGGDVRLVVETSGTTDQATGNDDSSSAAVPVGQQTTTSDGMQMVLVGVAVGATLIALISIVVMVRQRSTNTQKEALPMQQVNAERTFTQENPLSLGR